MINALKIAFTIVAISATSTFASPRDDIESAATGKLMSYAQDAALLMECGRPEPIAQIEQMAGWIAAWRHPGILRSQQANLYRDLLANRATRELLTWASSIDACPTSPEVERAELAMQSIPSQIQLLLAAGE